MTYVKLCAALEVPNSVMWRHKFSHAKNAADPGADHRVPNLISRHSKLSHTPDKKTDVTDSKLVTLANLQHVSLKSWRHDLFVKVCHIWRHRQQTLVMVGGLRWRRTQVCRDADPVCVEGVYLSQLWCQTWDARTSRIQIPSADLRCTTGDIRG